jgi:3-oxoacyl-[acyl-carrier-protein] synthase-1
MVVGEQKQVFVIGFGARTAVGATAIATAAAVRAGIARFAEHPYMIDKAGNRMVVAMAVFILDEVGGIDRFVELGLPSAEEAMVPLTKVSGGTESVLVLIGLPAERPGLPKSLSERVAERFKNEIQKRFRILKVETFNAGHSAGLMALEEGCRRILSGSVEICLVGGIESYHEPETLEWLDDENQLHSESNRWGFIPGEAAGFCLLCSKKAIDRLRLKVFGKVLAVATERETNLIKTDAVCLGEGLSKAVKQVIKGLPFETKIDYMICDLNGEPYRGDEFGYTIVRTSDRFVNPSDFLTPADCWGDVGAASGPLFIMLPLIAWQKGYFKVSHTLICASSEGGQRSTALLYTGN